MIKTSFAFLGLAAAMALTAGSGMSAWAAEPPATTPESGGPPSTWGGWGPGMGPGPAMGMMGMGPGAMLGTPSDIQGRMDDLKRQLGIAPSQESAWKAYQDGVTAQLALMSAHRQVMLSSGPPPLEQRLAMHQEGLTVAQRTAQAAQELYKVMTPEQRTKASALPLFGGGPGYGMWRAPAATAPAAPGSANSGR